ncbi:(3R)-3-[(carboxymethyl)amino]fatty acid oxygenase/decarboxylase [Streptomyces profundus]|uniref:(3R)-3-[(carboxymethyl)amino]fatty acid oxygenase/decarboxylase n=1 Tax=Streptomyces profundus TaxID=2867410 RepID=UPI001D167AAC|nr:TauD/TfdA family dioxygenase [Streptomyces sp. MA3_2.13]UED87275.1 TauD/TfdA family dioxygenase [Streptomyces sp. MA3_2.13]
MITVPQENAKLGIAVEDFDPLQVSPEQLTELKQLVYQHRIVVLRNQTLSSAEFVAFGRRLGEVETYYQPMYHHAEHKEIFVSSNVKKDGEQVGVPQTGKFWHHDYSFMPRPFGLTLIYPQVVPQKNRGTFFIDMAKAHADLTDELKAEAADTRVLNSVRRYFKIRPTDVYRPITDIMAEVERETPAVAHPTVFNHPVTGETLLYLSEAVSYQIETADGRPARAGLLEDLLEACGQADTTFEHENIHLQTFDKGDLLVWDNRALVHRALHTPNPEPTVSHRVTVHDEHPFYPGIGAE